MHFISKCSVLTLGYLHERDATIMLCFLAHTRQKWYTIYKHSKEEKDFLITRIQQSGSTSNKTCMKMFVCKKLQHEEKESDKGKLSKRCIGYVSSKEWDHNRKNNSNSFQTSLGFGNQQHLLIRHSILSQQGEKSIFDTLVFCTYKV